MSERFNIVKKASDNSTSNETPRFTIISKATPDHTQKQVEEMSADIKNSQYAAYIPTALRTVKKEEPTLEPSVDSNEIRKAEDRMRTAEKQYEAAEENKPGFLQTAWHTIAGDKDEYVDPINKDIDEKKKAYDAAREEYLEMLYGNAEERKARYYELKNKVDLTDAETAERDTLKKIITEDNIAVVKKDIEKGNEKASKVTKHASNIWNAGAAGFSEGVTSSVAVILETFGAKNNWFRKLNNQFKVDLEYYNAEMQKSASALGDENNISGQIGTGLVQALPDAVIALVTGYWGAAAQKASALGKSSVSLISKAGTYLSNMLKNPGTYTSFLREFGNNYDEAIENGASEAKAMASALAVSTINTGIEMGFGIEGAGGIQTLPELIEDASKSAARKAWIFSTLGEGGEEILQKGVSDVFARILYDEDREFNPIEQLKAGVMGSVVGGILGGGQVAVSSVLNTVSNADFAKIGAEIKNNENANDIIAYAARSLDPQVRALATNVSAKTISPENMGKLYQYMLSDITKAINTPEDVNTATDNFNEIMSNTNSEWIKSFASVQYIERLTEKGVDQQSIIKNMERYYSQEDTNYLDSQTVDGYNNNRGDENATFVDGGLRESTSNATASENAGGDKAFRGVRQEDAESFIRRTAQDMGETRRVVEVENSVLAYVPAESDNSAPSMAVDILNGLGAKAIYVKGYIESNQNGVTHIDYQALTAPDGTVYVSSNATLSDVQMASHEIVHVKQKQNSPEYISFESVVSENILWGSKEYIKIARELNKAQYNGKYDVEDIAFSKKFITEITAYINEFVATDPERAERNFALLCKDWQKVVDASKQFNKDIGADFSKSAFSMQQKYVFAGESSANADKMKLKTAKKMEVDGVDLETIRKETGWFRGDDGRWRFEINDSDARIKKVYLSDAGSKLNYLLKHDKLFKSYPQLKDIKVRVVSIASMNSNTAYCDLGRGEIGLNASLFLSAEEKEELKALRNSNVLKSASHNTEEFWGNPLVRRYYTLCLKTDFGRMSDTREVKGALLHEVQHIVQYIEGFAYGSSSEIWQKKGYSPEESVKLYTETAGERESRDVSARMMYDDAERQSIKPDVGREGVVFAGGARGFREPSPKFPPYDLLENFKYESNGLVRYSEEQKIIIAIGKALGWKIEFGDVRTATGAKADGKIDYKTKTITINTSNQQPIQFILKHELTHFGEGSEGYKSLVNAVRKSSAYKEWLSTRTGFKNSVSRMEDVARQQIIENRKGKESLTSEQAQSELIADFIGDNLFTDANAMQRLLENVDGKECNAIIQFLIDFFRYLREKLSGNNELSFELQRLESRYVQMLNESKKKEFNTSNTKFSFSPTNDIVDNALVNGYTNNRGDLLGKEGYRFRQDSANEDLGRSGNQYLFEGPAQNTEAAQARTNRGWSLERREINGSTVEVVPERSYTPAMRYIADENGINGFQTYFVVDDTIFIEETDNNLIISVNSVSQDVYSFEKGVASFTEQRLNYLYEQYSGKKTATYVAYISPEEFLSLTASIENIGIIRSEAGRLDLAELRANEETPFLMVNSETGEIVGHEGRHRISALLRAGIDKVAIVIESDSASQNKPLVNLKLSGQSFKNSRASGNVVINEAIPLTEHYRSEIAEKFVNSNADIQYSIPSNSKSAAERNFPSEHRTLFEQFRNGDITIEEYRARVESMFYEAEGAANQNVANLNKKHNKEISDYKKRVSQLEKSNARKSEQLKKRRSEVVAEETARRNERRDKQQSIEYIRREVGRIDKKLRANSDKNPVPQELQETVKSFCSIFLQNDQTVFDKKDLGLVALAYSNMAGDYQSGGESLLGAYDFNIEQELKTLASTLDGKTLRNLSVAQLSIIRDVVDNLRHMIVNENKLFLQGKSADIAEVAADARGEIRRNKAKVVTVFSKKHGETIFEQSTTPIYFFDKLGTTFRKLFDDIRDGQDKWFRNMEISKTYIQDIKERYHYSEWGNDTFSFKTVYGDEIELTREQALLLYATAKREYNNKEQGSEHLFKGGIVIDGEDIVSKTSNKLKKADKKKAFEIFKAFVNEIDSKSHQITPIDVGTVNEWLTEEQKAYADELVKYLSVDMAALGNETSMQLFGIRKYNEDYYIPYNSAQNFLYSQPGVTNEQRLKHQSFTKQTQKKARTPLMLTNFSEVCADHINRMCMYNAMTVPLENMNRVFNYSESGEEGFAPQSIKTDIESAFGKGALEYVQQFLTDMNGSVRSSSVDTDMSKWLARFKKGATFASASVVVQQPSAIARAFALVDEKYFLSSTFNFSERDYQELIKYAPVAGIKTMGRFDTGMGVENVNWLLQENIKGLKNKAKAFVSVTDSTYRDDTLTFLAAKADEITWGHIWAAVKAETADKTDLKQGSEEFLEYAGKRFRDVIDYTQVYDSTLSRSQIMRSKSAAAKMVTAFMAEPTVSLNLLMDAAQRKNSKYFARALRSWMASIVLNALLKSFVTAGRDDDEDKSYFEKYIGQFVGNAASDLFVPNMIPLVKDVVSIFEGYTVERVDMSLFADLADTVEDVFNDNKTTGEKITSVASSLGAFLGLPVKNILRDIKTVENVVKQFFTPSNKTTSLGIKYSVAEELPFGHSGKESDVVEDLVAAANKGDDKRYTEIYDFLEEQGKTESSIFSGAKKAYKNNSDVKSATQKQMKGIKNTDTFKSLDSESQAKIEKDIADHIASEKVVKNTYRNLDVYDELYELKRKNKKKYDKFKQQLLDKGYTSKQISEGEEVAKIAYLKSVGIDLNAYILSKAVTNVKNADTDNSGGVSAKEKRAAIKGMDLDEKVKKALLKYTK